MDSKETIKISSGKKIVGNTILSSFSELSLVFTSIFYILAARYLSDTGFGKFGTAVGFVGIFTLFIMFGFSYSITKIIVKERKKAGLYLGNALYIQLVFSAVYFLISLYVAYLLRTKYTLEVRYVIAIMFVAESLRCFTLTLRAGCKALGQYHYDAIAVNAERIFLLVVGIVLFLTGHGLFAVAVVVAVSRLVSLGILIGFMYRMHQNLVIMPNFKIWKMLLKKSYVYVAPSAFWRIYDYSDVVMISLMRPFHEVGWYRAGRQILEGLWFIPNILTEAIYPELNARHLVSRELVFKLFDRSFKYILSISVMVSIGTIVISRWLINLIYGPAYQKTVMVLILLGITVVPSYLRYMFGNTLIAINLQKKETYIAGGRSIFNAVGNLVLIYFYGYIGATIATVATDYFVIFVYFAILREEGLVRKSQLKFVYKPFVGAVSLIPVYYITRPIGDVIQFFIMITVYIVALFSLRIFDKEELTFFKNYVNRKRRKLIE